MNIPVSAHYATQYTGLYTT